MVAASFAILLQTSQFDRAGQPVAQLPQKEVVVPRVVSVSPVLVDAPPESSAPETATSLSHTEIASVLAKNVVPAAAAVASREPEVRPVAETSEMAPARELEHFRQFLDDPSLKRFFLVRGGPNDESEQKVASVVEHTTHLDFFKITVSQGIVIDPRHPDQATVFAFVLNPDQVDRFRDQLKVALPGMTEQQPLDPAIATQLVEISTVRSLPPASLARVEISRESIALRDKSGNTSESTSGVETPRLGEAMTVERPREEPESRVVVLVWVAGPPSK